MPIVTPVGCSLDDDDDYGDVWMIEFLIVIVLLGCWHWRASIKRLVTLSLGVG